MVASPRILYLVTEDWYFMSHRLTMARAVKRAGYEVHVATRISANGDAIAQESFSLHALDWSRGRTSPLALLNAVRQVRKLYRTVKPTIAHHVAVVPTIVGSLAAVDSRSFASTHSPASASFSLQVRQKRC